MKEKDLFYWIALNSIPSLRWHQFETLVPNMTEKLLQEKFGMKDLKWVEEELRTIQKEAIQIVTYPDLQYPF